MCRKNWTEAVADQYADFLDDLKELGILVNDGDDVEEVACLQMERDVEREARAHSVQLEVDCPLPELDEVVKSAQADIQQGRV